jgi:hypothetical protein
MIFAKLGDIAQSRFHIGGRAAGLRLSCKTQKTVDNAFYVTGFSS